jgi:hypothetical protein
VFRPTIKTSIVKSRCSSAPDARKFSSYNRGWTLIESTREPLLDTCLALIAFGVKGCLEVWGGEPMPSE